MLSDTNWQLIVVTQVRKNGYNLVLKCKTLSVNFKYNKDALQLRTKTLLYTITCTLPMKRLHEILNKVFTKIDKLHHWYSFFFNK